MTYGVVIGERGDPARWKAERGRRLPRGPGTPLRALITIQHLLTRDRAAALAFLRSDAPLSRLERLSLIARFNRITNAVRGYHTLTEMLLVSERVLRLAGRPGLRVVECGAGSGASTAKLSLAVRAAGGRLDVYDTFRGIPENDERHELLDGTPLRFLKGAFRGRLGAVQRRVALHGAPEVCRYEKGLFEDTLPSFDGPVDVALLDVDLVASTRTCLRALYPKLREGGCILSQDGHLRATHALLRDADFWRGELGEAPPRVRPLADGKLLEISRPGNSTDA